MSHNVKHMPYSDRTTVEERKRESERIRAKYPNRIPVIVERDTRSDVSDIDRCKFLVPNDLTVGQLTFVIRKRIKLGATDALFCFVVGSDSVTTLPPTGGMLSDVYKNHQNEDGFLYVRYASENTFGSL